MKKVAWITDSTCILSDEVCQKHHIYKVPLTLILDDVSYRDGIDMTIDEVLHLLKEKKASTSQPAISDLMSLFEELKANYDEGVCYHISSKLSGTYSSCLQMAEQAEFLLQGVDSKHGIHPMSHILLEAVMLYEKGATIEEALHYLRTETEKICIVFTVDTLQQLHRSGRVKNTQALLGSLLNIKPILEFIDGSVETVDKVRSRKKSLQWLVERLQRESEQYGIRKISIFHSDEEAALQLKEKISSLYPTKGVDIHPISPVVGVLTGKGTIGLTWIRKI